MSIDSLNIHTFIFMYSFHMNCLYKKEEDYHPTLYAAKLYSPKQFSQVYLTKLTKIFCIAIHNISLLHIRPVNNTAELFYIAIA